MPRPSRPLITRDMAAAEGLKIIDAEGIESLSLERLAQAMGIKAPSLYHHFSGKAEILSHIARLITFGVRVPPEPAVEDWAEWFVAIGTGFRRAVLRHPRAAPLLVQYFPRRFTLSTYERGANLMERAGVPVALHAMIFEGLDRLTFGSALLSAVALVNEDQDLFPGLDPDRDPALVRAAEANPFDDEALFQETVRSFLRGAVAATVPAARRPGRRAAS